MVVRVEIINLVKEVIIIINIGDVNDNNLRIIFMKEFKNIVIEDYLFRGSFVIKVSCILEI